MNSEIDLGRPVAGDVIDLILADHYRFERLLRMLRESSQDREAVRAAFSTLHVAHAVAEEEVVYPKLQRKRAISGHEAEHGEEEHAEGHEALEALLAIKGTDTQAFEDALEELSAVVQHHLVEEELSILNPAREDVTARVRHDLGAKFAAERNRQVEAGRGSLSDVRALVAKARSEDLLDES